MNIGEAFGTLVQPWFLRLVWMFIASCLAVALMALIAQYIKIRRKNK